MELSQPPKPESGVAMPPVGNIGLAPRANHWISSMPSQNDGVATAAIETTRTSWSCQLSRYRAPMMPKASDRTTAISTPRKRQLKGQRERRTDHAGH